MVDPRWKIAVGDRVRIGGDVNPMFQQCTATVVSIDGTVCKMDIELRSGGISRGVTCGISSQHLLTLIDDVAVQIEESELDMILGV